MTIDVQSLRGAVRELKDEVTELRRRVEAVEQQLAADETTAAALQLPPEIVVQRPAAVADYLRDRPALAQLVSEMAPAILREFCNEPAQIVLDLYEDPEINDRYMVFYVRLSEYPDSLLDRLHQISDQFDNRAEPSDDWVLVTTDFHDPA